MAQPVTDAQFADEVLKSPLPVLIDFWAPWCGPCKAMLPIVEELETEYAGKVKVVKMNVDENTEIPGQFNVMSIPTFVMMKGGQPVGSFIGARSKQEMKSELDRIIGA